MIFPEAITDLPMYRSFADAVKVPMLANITEFGKTPLFTVEELRSADVGLVLYPLSAFRAMNKAALRVYEAVRRDGTQKNVVGCMQTRDELYDFLDYHAYEQKLDELFAKDKTATRKRTMSNDPAPPSQAQEIGRAVRRAGGQHRAVHGRPQGNDLHYRGYDILDFAEQGRVRGDRLSAGAREAAHVAELPRYKKKLKTLRGCPPPCKAVLECIPAKRTRWTCCAPACSALGTVLPEKRRPQDRRRAQRGRPADGLVGLDAAVLVPLQPPRHAASTSRPTTTRSAAHFLHLLHGRKPPELWVRRCTPRSSSTPSTSSTPRPSPRRVIAGTGSDMYSAITGAIGALRGPKHGGANEFAFEMLERYDTPTRPRPTSSRRVAEKEIIIGFGHPVYTIADPRNQVIKEVARRLSQAAGDMKLFDIAERVER